MSDPIDQEIPVVLLWLDEESRAERRDVRVGGAKDLIHGPGDLATV